MLIFPYRLRPASRRAQSDLLHDRHNDGPPPEPSGDAQQDAQAALQPQHRLRGVLGYHNPFKDPFELDSADQLPPAYGSKCQSTRLRRIRSLELPPPEDADIPRYDCSVFLQNIVEVKVEKESPFEYIDEPKWQSRFAVLTGTQLCLHEIKKYNALSMAANPLLPRETPGKLVKRYTLQHAEVGLAADHRKYILVPKSALVNLLSATAIEHMQATEPHKFDKIYQYVVRLRVEMAQILLKFPTSHHRNEWIAQLSAAIDIAQPLETRTEPKVVTLPRRRRRRPNLSNLDAMRDDQIRIAREQFPSLVPAASGAPGGEDDGEPDTVHDVDDGRQAEPGTHEVEDAEHAAAQSATAGQSRRTSNTRRSASLALADSSLSRAQQTAQIFNAARGLEPFSTGQSHHGLPVVGTAESASHGRVTPIVENPVAASSQNSNDEPPSDFDADTGKWNPFIAHDQVQESRIRRRCMPSLLFNSKRASDIAIANGKRVRIDWEAQLLRPWPEMPPCYSASVDAPQNEDVRTRNGVRQAMNSPHRPAGEFTAREQSQTRAESAASARHGRTRSRLARRFTTNDSELRVAVEAPVPRVTADDATSGTSDGSISPGANRNLFNRLPGILRRMTSRQGNALKMMHNNKSYAGQTGKERAYLHQDDTEGIDRLHSHASSMVGRDDALLAAPLAKVQSAVEPRPSRFGLGLEGVESSRV